MTLRAEHDSLWGYLQGALTPKQLSRPLLANFNHWAFVQQTVAEIALTLNQMGSQVEIAFWGGNTPIHDTAYSTSNKIASLLLSPSREQRIVSGLKACGIPNSAFTRPPLRKWNPQEQLRFPDVLNRSSIRAMKYRGADIGRAILQVHPDLETPITDRHLWPDKWVKTAARSFAYVFDQTTELIIKNEVTSVFVYNGRFLHDRAVAEAAQQLGIATVNYDTGGADTDFDLTVDPTHDWSRLQERMMLLYDGWNPSERDEIGSGWFAQRANHADQQNQAYTDAQEIGLTIEVPSDKKIVVYFSSSGDEIVELDLDWNEYFGDQDGALRELGAACQGQDDLFLVVRTHPHKRRKPRLDVAQWHESVKAVNPDVHLDEHSEIDSYALMRQADVVVTYGSTTGIEAAFSGRPVIVMGPSAYDELDAVQRVKNSAQLRAALAKPSTRSKKGAIAFGLMMQRRGFNYSATSPNGRFELHGRNLEDSNQLVLHASHFMSKISRSRLLR